MDNLDEKLNELYAGKVVRKDLLHQIKEGTNIPSFVLEFLLARYCASDDQDEINAGKAAVIETLEKNYVRPDEANKAQSLVQQMGSHKFIDKVHVKYSERERRHWAEMENFNSRRIAIPDRFYRNNDRLLEGGIWAEVKVSHNDNEEDDYAFAIEDLKPIQLGRFDFDKYAEGRKSFSRDEWLDIIIRSFGLEPTKMSIRLKFHFLSRLFSLVEPNYNFIELGPRGTGKSYSFSEFSPYSTLISGGQASTATLFYNNNRRCVGLIGFWDNVAFDEVAGIKIKDAGTVQIMKDYMANGRFSRGVEVNAPASLSFVGNIDHSIDQLVNSNEYDLFLPLPKTFDLAIMDRFYNYLPGWEMPKNTRSLLTSNYGFISDYLAEAFHFLLKQGNRYDFVKTNVKLGKSVEGRDEKAVLKTISAILKILHPNDDPTSKELSEYTAYALEGRRRIKEQMNKRKPDDEYANINLSYYDQTGKEVVVYCPESRTSEATQHPKRKQLGENNVLQIHTSSRKINEVIEPVIEKIEKEIEDPQVNDVIENVLTEKHLTISYGDSGFSYESLFGDYLVGVKEVYVEDPYIRSPHQIQNFVRFCELLVKFGSINSINLATTYEDDHQKKEAEDKFISLLGSLAQFDKKFNYIFQQTLHDREIRLDNGWIIKIGRGFDYFQKPDDWYSIGANDLDLRPCLETKVDIFKIQSQVVR